MVAYSMLEATPQSTEPLSSPLSGTLTFAMAIATGLAVANIYYNQPMLGVIEHTLPASPYAGLIPTATQLGYALGLFLLVPLGDIRDRRRLIVTQFVILAMAAMIAALSPTALALVAASVLLGASATVAQQIVPFAAALAAPAQRGRTIGTVMGGLLCGILFSRTLAGFIAAHFGWREMFWLSAPLALLGAVTMAIALPRNHPHSHVGYVAALKSIAHLWREEPTLRTATLAQAAGFSSFSTFWTILALHLQEPAFSLGAQTAGLFGILGVVGVAAAPLAGRIADHRGPVPVIRLGIVLILSSWLVFGLWNSLVGLAVGVIVLDFGAQSVLVSHQHVIYALRPEARSRLNTVLMTGMFLGGGIGSAAATVAWNYGGWPVVCGLGALFALVALILRLAG
jgi:predicted MFS family arabinose efflux permease